MVSFLEKARDIHGNFYDYTQCAYVSSKIKIKIICPIHGTFEQTPSDHLSGKGCPKCGKERCKKKLSLAKDEIKNKIFNCYKHQIVLDEDKEQHYENNKSFLELKCLSHGRFKRKASLLFSGCGCPKCVREEKRRQKEKSFIERAKILYDGKYDYSKVEYVGNKNKVCIICSEHGEFWQRPNDHLSGHGCKHCGQTNQTELKVKQMLEQEFINVEHQKTFDWLKHKHQLYIDFYLPDYNVAIEYQGRQHFSEKAFCNQIKNNNLNECIQRDLKKIELIKQHNIKLYHLSFETKDLPCDFGFYHIYDNLNEIINLIKK